LYFTPCSVFENEEKNNKKMKNFLLFITARHCSLCKNSKYESLHYFKNMRVVLRSLSDLNTERIM